MSLWRCIRCLLVHGRDLGDTWPPEDWTCVCGGRIEFWRYL